MNKTLSKVLLGLAALLTALAGGYGINETLGSVAQTNEYQSIVPTEYTGSGTVLQTGVGALGSVVITKLDTGTIAFHDVTTTDQNLRAAGITSSTQLMAYFPASVAVGTYTFDASYHKGLAITITGDAPSSTITYR